MKTQGNLSAELRALRILYFAMIIGVFFLAAIIIGLSIFDPGKENSLQPYSEIIVGISGGIALICFLFARSVFGKKVGAIRNSSVSVQEKLNLYRTALISYLAICEAAAILAIMLYMLTVNYWLLVIAGLMWLAMVLMFPSRQRLYNDLLLDWKDQQSFE